MRMVSPNTGAPEAVIAEDQHEYKPLTVAKYMTERGAIVLLSRWKPSDEERQRIAAGEDVFVSLMTFGQPMQPINVQVGDDGWRIA